MQPADAPAAPAAPGAPALAPPVEPPSSTSTVDGQPPQPRARRKLPQVMADEVVADELIEGAPSRNGGRLLTDDRDPWTHNAWDQVTWGAEEETFAQAALERQRGSPVPQHLQDEFNANPAAQWDTFYKHNKDNFFKERSWLNHEFPDLADCLKPDAGPRTVVEIGCGNGSTLFPLLADNENPLLDLHGYDYSKEAVAVVKSSPSFDPARCRCDVWDLSSREGPPPTVKPGSVDVLTMIFVFSALHPDEWAQAVRNAHEMLKPGGILLFRDYGRNDLAMLRFKANRYMQDGLYVRGDNTRVYFFERDELQFIFGGVRRADGGGVGSISAETGPADADAATETTTTTLEELASGEVVPTSALPSLDTTLSSSRPSTPSRPTSSDAAPAPAPALAPTGAPSPASLAVQRGETLTPIRFELLKLGVDRRLLLNRKRQLKMFRVWMQGRWRKPLDAPAAAPAGAGEEGRARGEEGQ
ncbi:hypothetical protein JCM8208_002345 [Rhodotorula glutinis]